MEKIILTSDEVQLIEKYLDGDFDAFNASEKEQEIMSGVIDKAEKLVAQLDAYDDMGDDLVKWFYDLYKSQQ